MPSETAVPGTRSHPRVDAGFMVKVLRHDRTLLYRTRDLSMTGLFVEDLRVFPGHLVTVELPLPHDRDVHAECTVRRLTDEGVALEFTELDWDDMFALARYLYPRLP
jgi:PilZ domain